jgi:hypothetical protein
MACLGADMTGLQSPSSTIAPAIHLSLLTEFDCTLECTEQGCQLYLFTPANRESVSMGLWHVGNTDPLDFDSAVLTRIVPADPIGKLEPVLAAPPSPAPHTSPLSDPAERDPDPSSAAL